MENKHIINIIIGVLILMTFSFILGGAVLTPISHGKGEVDINTNDLWVITNIHSDSSYVDLQKNNDQNISLESIALDLGLENRDVQVGEIVTLNTYYQLKLVTKSEGDTVTVPIAEYYVVRKR